MHSSQLRPATSAATSVVPNGFSPGAHAALPLHGDGKITRATRPAREPERHGGDRVLTSWKEIALYLGKGVRTVQRWEQDFGLPVRRPAGASEKKGPILALACDVDAWVALHCHRLQRPSERESSAARPGSLQGRIQEAFTLRTTNQMLLMELRAGIAVLRQRLEMLAASRGTAESLVKQVAAPATQAMPEQRSKLPSSS